MNTIFKISNSKQYSTPENNNLFCGSSSNLCMTEHHIPLSYISYMINIVNHLSQSCAVLLWELCSNLEYGKSRLRRGSYAYNMMNISKKEPFLSYVCAPTNCKGFKFFEVNVNRKEGLLLMIQHSLQYQND